MSAAEFDSETLHDELLAESEIWVGAHFQKSILGKERISDASHNGLFLVISESLLISLLFNLQVTIFLLNVQDVLDLVR